MFESLEFAPAAQDDDGAGFTGVAGPGAWSRADPYGEGEAAGRMRVFPARGGAFEVAACGLRKRRVLRVEGVG